MKYTRREAVETGPMRRRDVAESGQVEFGCCVEKTPTLCSQ
jgi:hypothetical protein